MHEKQDDIIISVLGDSISTYAGYNPFGYLVYYKDDAAYENELTSVDDTWWVRVISSLGGRLGVNNSYAGRLVIDTREKSTCSAVRCAALDDGEAPSLILVYMGTNDRGYGVEVGLEKENNPQCFYGGYRKMLRELKANYPFAKIACATLPLAYKRGESGVNASKEALKNAELYNAAIRLAVSKEECLLADVVAFGERYEALDYCHPTATGHATLAELWLKCLENLL